MKNIRYILALLALALISCNPLEQDNVLVPAGHEPTGKVMVSFQVAVPGEPGRPSTKAMANTPAIDNIYVAVFGGSGFYNEWIRASIDNVSEANYNGTSSTVYNVSVALTMSDSRLRLHFIANCPERFKTNPPITGISSQDLEEVVMSKVRSHISDTYNDAYWQKVILPNGVKAKVVEIVDGEGNITEDYYVDGSGNYVASDATLAQFPNPIPLVRNFARVYLRNLTTDVTIARYGLVFAPAEGPVAPILAEAFPSDTNGDYITNLDSYSGKIYYENFFRNYQNYPLISDTPTTLVTDAPYNYEGYSPDYVTYGSYPDPNDPSKDANYPTFSEMHVWDSSISNDTGLQEPLFVYERGIPTSEHRATRVLIYAHKDGEVDELGADLYKYYSLDIVDTLNNYIPLLRNQTYTVKLIGIEAGSGESSIEAAAGSSSATVSGDPATQYVTEISDGSASISTSYAEMLYVKPGTYDVFFRYIPTYAGENAGQEDNSLVTWQVGTKNESTGTFTAIPAGSATNSVFQISGGDYSISIDKNNGQIVTYVRHGEGFTSDPAIVAATPDKWAKLSYTTVGTASDGLIDSDGYFTVMRNAAIRITGSYEGHDIFRDVLVKISPRKSMMVKCLQKYVQSNTGETEVVRVYIPTDLPRAVFPLQFKVEAAQQSITPYGDILPVETGQSIVPNKTGPSYFFIKNLTRTDYSALSTETVNGVDWYYFDCTFKTTMVESASYVYVYNAYFDDATNNDNFENYTQRLFSGLAFQSSLRVETPVEFIFTMDTAHGNNTVWWDPAGNLSASLSTSNKVLPKAVLVTLEGLEPELNEATNRPYTAFSSGSAYDPNPNDDISYYLYNVGDANSAPTVSMADATLRLVVNASANGTCRVGLSTLNITENQYLYAEAAQQGTASGLTLTLNKSSMVVGVGKTGTLTATVTPSDPTDAANIVWSSSNTRVASVSGSGVVTGVASGTAVITATLGSYSASCTVRVRAIREESINTTSSNLSNGNNRTLSQGAVSIVFSNINTVNANYVRPGSRSTITITASTKELYEVVVTFDGNNYTYNMTVNTGTRTLSGTIWTWTATEDNTTSLVATNTNNTTRRIRNITVRYFDD